MTIQIKATEEYFPVVLFCTRSFNLLSLWVKFLSVTGHSNESYRAVLSCGAVYYAIIQGGSNFNRWSDTSTFCLEESQCTSLHFTRFYKSHFYLAFLV